MNYHFLDNLAKKRKKEENDEEEDMMQEANCYNLFRGKILKLRP